jgi:hypothetical protein
MHSNKSHWKAKRQHKRMGIGRLFLGALLVMVLWNAVMPDLFGFPRLGYWQAFAVLFLSRLLFGGWPGCGGSYGHVGGRWREDLAAKMKKKFEAQTRSMSDEEKERFRRGFTSGQWDVNIIDVEEEKENQDDDDASDPGEDAEKGENGPNKADDE